MLLNIEELLGAKNLKVGDKIHFIGDDKDDIYTIAKDGKELILVLPNGFNSLFVNSLWYNEFEIVKENK